MKNRREALTVASNTEPIRTLFGGYELVTAPPPSSGGIAIAEILNIIEPWDVNSLDPVLRTHLLVEAMRRAYRDRAIHLGDPDFVEMPIEMLTSRHYADGLRASILRGERRIFGLPELFADEGTGEARAAGIPQDVVDRLRSEFRPYASLTLADGETVALSIWSP